MPTLEERFYSVAALEVAEGKLNQVTWGRAVSFAIGDDQKARALYLGLRVGELEREYQQSIADLLGESWAEITSGKPFLCPYCHARVTANTQDVEVDFLVQLFTRATPGHRYYCKSCGVELRIGSDPVRAVEAAAAASAAAASAPAEPAKSNNGMALTGFLLGLVSVAFYAIGIIPILAVVFSGIGLGTFKPAAQTNKWMAGVGLALGVVYTIMMLNQYGHLR
jgi:hypothetical protein